MFICVLDYKNLDNPLFLKAFAETLKKVNPEKCIILHSDSPYTERIMQTGVMRETAQLRSIQDLNHRLVTFFADYGLPCIGINGFQRNTVIIDEAGDIRIDSKFIRSLPNKTHVVLSGLGLDLSTQNTRSIPLPEFTQNVSDQLGIEPIYLFTTDEKSHFIANFDAPLRKIAFPSQNDENNIPDGYPHDLMGLKRPHYMCKPLFNINLKKFDASFYVGFKD